LFAFRKPDDSIKLAYANSCYHSLKIARVPVRLDYVASIIEDPNNGAM
jgi:hypothetical protein